MLSPKQAAELLGRTTETLMEWRKNRRGPPFHKYEGRYYYTREDISLWLAANRTDTITK